MVRKIRAKLILQLRADGLSGRAIAASQGMSRKSITAVLDAAEAAGIGWDEVAELEDEQVYAKLFPGRGEHESVFAQPDWERVHREMARVGVTLKLLHGEYVDATAAAGDPAMGYDRFCRTYQRHVLVTGAASRVGHKAGQSVEVDWSGPTMELLDPITGARAPVFLFVACLPFSRYAFCWPSLDMKQSSWLRAHVAMFEAFGGSVPRIVPDNLKTGVIKHPREGEIVLNDAYREMSTHYSAAVLPGRVKKPKDYPEDLVIPSRGRCCLSTGAVAGDPRDNHAPGVPVVGCSSLLGFRLEVIGHGCLCWRGDRAGRRGGQRFGACALNVVAVPVGVVPGRGVLRRA